MIGAVIVGVGIRIAAAFRLGRAGRDTIPFPRPSEAGSDRPASRPARIWAALTHDPEDDHDVRGEENDMSIVQPSFVSSPNRALAMTAGSMFAIWGVLGFFFAGNDGHAFLGNHGGYLWGAFMVNPAMAFIWAALAAALLIGGMGTLPAARSMNVTVGVIVLVIGVYGFVFKDTTANVLAANTTDNVFHVIVGAILLLTALGADRQNLRAIRGLNRAGA